ncbi:hypothetical protein ABHV50_004200 [Vibrio vulnificus]|nr:hypothetical protein [Vibrio vulnificus]
MKWLEKLIQNFTQEKDSVADELLHTPKNLVSRTLGRATVRAVAYLNLARRDLEFSKKALITVESCTSTVSTLELKQGSLYLNSHIGALESRKSYLVIYAALLASFILLFKLIGLSFLSVVIAAIGIPIVAIDRVFITHRIHLLEDLREFLEFVVNEREK